jgi:hypothetical protein
MEQIFSISFAAFAQHPFGRFFRQRRTGWFFFIKKKEPQRSDKGIVKLVR